MGHNLGQANITLNKTTQKKLCSAVLILARRYRTDRVFTRKILQVQWPCDIINGRGKSMGVNQYAQIFAKKPNLPKV